MKKINIAFAIISLLNSCSSSTIVKEKTNPEKIVGYWIGHEKGADVTLDIKPKQVIEMRYITLNPYSDTTVTGTYAFKENDTRLTLDFGPTLLIQQNIIVLTDTEMTLQESNGKAQTAYKKQLDK
jgi:hypothetical protein